MNLKSLRSPAYELMKTLEINTLIEYNLSSLATIFYHASSFTQELAYAF